MNSLNGGYAMIKYNSTQEELQIAYRSKKPVLCYDENRRAHWAVIEETATESVDEETQEPITIYEYSYRLIDEASGGGATLEDIVDSHGNKRFIEGNLTFETAEGITYTYGKWSLSGTHLMIVFCAEFTQGITIAPKQQLAKISSLPNYILDKIIPSGIYVARESMYTYKISDDEDYATMNILLSKENNELIIKNYLSLNVAYDSYGRCQFDLLIDAE